MGILPAPIANTVLLRAELGGVRSTGKIEAVTGSKPAAGLAGYNSRKGSGNRGRDGRGLPAGNYGGTTCSKEICDE
jgi:hypothetical protein